MTETFNGCTFTKIWASPSNWETTTSVKSLKQDWYVQCFFFDPRLKNKYSRNGFAFRKRVNKLKTIEERRAAIRFYMEEMATILKAGYNPISKEDMDPPSPPEPGTEYNGKMPLRLALPLAADLSSYEKLTRQDIKSVLKYFLQSAEAIGYHEMAIEDVITIHVDLIMDNLVKNVRPLSNDRYNKYLAHLSSLFTTLRKKGLTEKTVLQDYEKKDTVREKRELLTIAERVRINNFLSVNYPRFWLYCVVFFHCGGREVELLRLKYEDVDLDNLVYKTLVKKRKKHTIVYRPIKKIAVPYFEKALMGAKKGDILFSVGLLPGPEQIHRDQVTRRWRVHVKQKLGINKDMYVLKHGNLTEIADRSSAKEAARAAGHTTTKMVEKHYDANHEVREMNKVRAMTNEFAPVQHTPNQEFCNPPVLNLFIRQPSLSLHRRDRETSRPFVFDEQDEYSHRQKLGS